VAVIAALVAGLVALTGFLVNGSLNRAAEKRKACAEALSVIEQYAQLPFTFYRRADDDPQTKAKLGDLLAKTQVDLAFHKKWLRLEDPAVADAYETLADKYSAKNSEFRRYALEQPPGSVEVPRDHPFRYGATAEWEHCIELMRAHINRTRLAFWKV
jgi:hypothetical protein